MNVFKRILGSVVPPYKSFVLRQEQSKLFTAIINSLPEDFKDIKEQTLSARFWGLTDWKLYPDFKLVTLSYGWNKVLKYKKRGQNFKVSGLKIFSNLTKQFEEIEILVCDNLAIGLKIKNSQFQLGEFHIGKVDNLHVTKSGFTFPPSDLDIFYDSLDQEIKSKLNPDELFDIDFSNRTFYAFYDLEDGNYLAVDKHQRVYSLVHDAKPMAKGLKIPFSEVLSDIENNKFDKEKHLEARFRISK